MTEFADILLAFREKDSHENDVVVKMEESFEEDSNIGTPDSLLSKLLKQYFQ